MIIPKCVKNNNPCDIHKDGKYFHWKCGNGYNSKIRHQRYLNNRKKCIDCGTLINQYAKRCRKCAAKINANKMKGNKLPPEWAKNVSNACKLRSGDKNWEWKGDEASYSSFHKWLTRHYSKPKQCNFCGKETKWLDWALKVDCSHSHNRDNYVVICRSCHWKYDRGLLINMSTNCWEN